MSRAALRPSCALTLLASFATLLGVMVFVSPPPAFADPLSLGSSHDRIVGPVVVESDEVVSGASSKVGDVRVRGLVDGDAGSFAGSVVLEGPVSGDVETAFGDVRVEAPLGGSVRTGMGDVRAAAPVGGDVRAAFGDVYVDTIVGGNVEVEHGDLTLGPNARVGGDVVCGNGLCDYTQGARVAGNVMSGSMNGAGPGFGGGGGGLFSWLVPAALLAGASLLVALVAPRPLAASATAGERHPVRSLALGFGSALAAAVGGVVLMFSGIGIPLLLLLVPAYLALVVFGTLVACFLVGRKVAFLTGGYRQGPAFAALVGAAAVSAVLLLPLGSVILALIGLFGAGATLTALISRRLRGRAV